MVKIGAALALRGRPQNGAPISRAAWYDPAGLGKRRSKSD